MRLVYPTISGKNYYLAQTVPKIPLGTPSRYLGPIVWARYPLFEGVMISDTYLIAGGTGSGKSVMAKLILWFISQDRPVIDFDWAGQDSFLMHEPNSRPENLPPHTSPAGIPGAYLFYPSSTARVRRPYEKLVRPNLNKYSSMQLEALGFSKGAAKYLKTILKKYGPFKNLDVLYDFIEHFPVDDFSSRETIKKIESGRIRLRHPKKYLPNDTIIKQSKESIKKILPGLIDKNVFNLDNSQEFDFFRDFTGYARKDLQELLARGETPRFKGQNMVFSFNDKDVGRVEINYYMKQIEIIRKQYPGTPHYFVKIEEAHKVLAQTKEMIDEVIEDFVLVCRKLSVGLILVMPEVINLSGRVLNDMKNIITGKFKGDNANKLIAAMGRDQRSFAIPYLKFNRYVGKEGREMLVYNQDYNSIFVIHPFNAPCEIHREETSQFMAKVAKGVSY